MLEAHNVTRFFKSLINCVTVTASVQVQRLKVSLLYEVINQEERKDKCSALATSLALLCQHVSRSWSVHLDGAGETWGSAGPWQSRT